MKVVVSDTLKGELVLSSIKKKFKPGTVVDLPGDLASHADVLWAKKRGYISFDDVDEKISTHTNEDEVEFVNTMNGGVMVSFLKRTLAPNQRFILKKSDPNLEIAMKLVGAGYLSCASSTSTSTSTSTSSSSSEVVVERKNSNKDIPSEPKKKVVRKSFKTKKRDIAVADDAIFGMMNTEIG